MCDPLTIAGIALTGLSTGMNYAAQAKVQRARDDAMAAERIRQQGLDQQADALNVQSQDRFKDFQGKQDAQSASLADYYKGQEVPPAAVEDALPTSSSDITVREENKQRAKAKEFTNRTGNALGELRSFGDLLGEIGRGQARDASEIGQIGSFKRGSSNVLGYELDAANSKGNGLKLFADLAGGAGSLALNSGLSGGSLFGSAAASPKLPDAVSTVPTPRPTALVGDPWAGMRKAGISSLYSPYG